MKCTSNLSLAIAILFVSLNIISCISEKKIATENKIQAEEETFIKNKQERENFQKSAQFVGSILSKNYEFLYFADNSIDTLMNFNEMLAVYSENSHIPVKPFKIEGKLSNFFYPGQPRFSLITQQKIAKYFGNNAKFTRYGGLDAVSTIFVRDAVNPTKIFAYPLPALFLRNIHNSHIYSVISGHINSKIELASSIYKVATVDINLY